MLPILLSIFMYFMAAQPKESNLQFQIRSGIDMKVTDRQLVAAKNLKDLNAGFPASWIQKYVETEIWLPEKGIRIKSNDDQLTAEQRKVLAQVPLFGKIQVSVQYQQENQQTNKWDNRGIYFTVTHIPEKLAEFPGGNETMDAWWNKDRLNDWLDRYPKLHKAELGFQINDKGKVQQVEFLQSSGQPDADQWLLEEIKKMPDWTPAQTREGKPVVQKFQLVLENAGC